ncbi:hypothetical protein [Merismopedia glauca]|uniref:Neurotransmitter-gated ion-channel ligand-binding domain-containing protein n=1 Tax=Merismopedia glauca CCAP 1448/3 TaxID=1296344 RepID=A0A2T1C4Y5_9CYAN|nr:hypothetical protein [Merismopedia glauca]PSB03197.1 hypothetical protein C7B64_09615 [Merismopedia glauca CCAP 1448/3]
MRHKIIYFLTFISIYIPLNTLPSRAQETNSKTTKSQLTEVRPNLSEPTQVSVGIYLVDFDKFDEQNESFKLDGYLFLTWKDQRLAFQANQNNLGSKTYKPGEIWLPDVHFANVELKREKAYTQIKVNPDGTVNYKERFKGTFKSEMDVRRFPFDRQKLKLVLESPLNDTEQVIFNVDKSKTGRSSEAFLTGWKIGEQNAVAEITKSEVENIEENQYIYEIDLFRDSDSYFWNIIVPLLLIIAVSFTVFWSRSFESNTVISFSSLLSAIAFNIVIAEELPKVAYLTFINGFILISYLVICLAIIQIVIKHYLNAEKKEDISMKMDRICRWLFPTSFGISNLILILIFLI